MLKRRIASQFVAFACVGAVATSLQYMVLIMLVHGFDVWPTAASDIGMVLGAVVNYALNRRFTFISLNSHLKTVPRFAVVAGTGLLLNTLVIAGLLAIHAYYLNAQIMATGVVLIWNFALNRAWTFGASEKPTSETLAGDWCKELLRR